MLDLSCRGECQLEAFAPEEAHVRGSRGVAKRRAQSRSLSGKWRVSDPGLCGGVMAWFGDYADSLAMAPRNFATPLLGGAANIGAILAAPALARELPYWLLFGTAGLLVIGSVDDIVELRRGFRCRFRR